jgi:hypothetical protein
MPLLERKRVILAKTESTYGTDPTPTGVADAVLVRNLSVTPQDADFTNRDLVRPYLGRSEQLPSGIRAMIEFEVEMAASGTAGTAPAYGSLLKACGLGETVVAVTSVTYAPVSTNFSSVTIYYNNDGVLHKMTGCRGTVSLSMRVKDIPVFRFSFTGIYQAVTDTAAPTPTYTAYKTPLPVTNANTTPFTLHSFSGIMSELTIDVANSVTHRTLVGGSESVLITDREPVGSVIIEATTVAQKDWWTIARNGTLGGLAITHGTVAGQKVQVASSTVQLTRPVYQDMDGVTMLQMGMNFVPSTGNDELSFIFT